MRTRRLFGTILRLWLVLFSLAGSPASGATLPTGFTEALIASGLASPTAMEFAPDGRLFVCEQGGRLRVIKDGVLQATPFLTLTVSSAGERGLLGVAFDPDFLSNGFVYVYYTATTPAVHNRISRFTASGDVAIAGSEVVIFELDNLSSATIHNGGALSFGPDGKLYVAVGENANGAKAQTLDNLLGKMLRINPDGSIPTDNPFYNTATGKNRAIWALGLRNPFTFAFNRTGPEMFINDVGQNTWEEINDGLRGANYGWPETEGTTTDPRFESPRYAYTHSDGCAIVGGAFYSPGVGQFPPDYYNDYFFADYCGGWVRKLDPAAANSVSPFATGLSFPVDLKVSDDGSLYYLARGTGGPTGVVYRIEYGVAAPTITMHPVSQTVRPGAAATFSVHASGAPPLRYQWQRDRVDIPGATAQDYTIAAVTLSDNGAQFRAVVTNDAGNAISNEAVLTVTANQPPTATITEPAAGTLYSGGTVINYAGTATDPEDGTLVAAAFTWRVDFHHETHTHPFIPPTSGTRSGSFTIPTTGETSANVWYRIYLTVRDSGGLSHTTERDVLPRKVRLTLGTNPPGLQLRLNGQPIATPLSFDAVVGIVHSLAAPTPQAATGTTYEFVRWSDGGAATHNISTPAANTTYTASYTVALPAGCLQSNHAAWQNAAFATQTALFQASFEATPAAANMDGVTGLSLGGATTYTELAAIVRFNPAGFIDARNGANYAANIAVPYSAGATYHFRLQINPAGRVYSIYVTPPGSAEIVLGTSFAFRSEQSGISSLNNWAVFSATSSHTVCNFSAAPPVQAATPAISPAPGSYASPLTVTITDATPGAAIYYTTNGATPTVTAAQRYNGPFALSAAATVKAIAAASGFSNSAMASSSYTVTLPAGCLQSSNTVWQNTAMATQSVPFQATFDVTPNLNNMDGVVGLSSGSATTYSKLAAIIRFNPAGFMDARNGGNYGASASVPYSAGASYHFRLEIHPAAHVYTIYVTPPGGAEITLGAGFAFRSEQSAVASLNNWALFSAKNTHQVCNFAVVPLGDPLPSFVNAAYSLNAGSGSAAADLSGNKNNGTLGNGAAWTTAGKYGSALTFDGTDDFVSVPDTSSLDIGANGTIEAWVKLNRISRWSSVIAKGNVNSDPATNYALEVSNANRFVCILGNGSSSRTVSSTVTVTTGTFYHVACVWNGTRLQLYLNGVLNTSVAQNLTPAVNSGPLYIGQFGGNADRLAGVIDEVRVYGRALSQVEVAPDMNAPLVP